MAAGPTVSICIPTFNRARWLEEAVESCFHQSYDDIEIVVSDNASTDATESVIRSFDDSRLRYHCHRTPVPPVANWNSSWRASEGAFVTFLCDDDALEPDFVLSMVELTRVRPSASLYRSGLKAVGSGGQKLWEWADFSPAESAEEFFSQRVRFGRLQFLPGFLFRRTDMTAIGGVLEVGLPGMLYVDDFLWFRIAFRGTGVAGVTEPLWRYRQHELQYGGSTGLDLDAFSHGLPGYVTMLADFADAQGCSRELVSFVRTRYLQELLRTRIQIELHRARSRSVISQASKLLHCVRLASKHGLNIRALLKGVYP